MWDYFRYDSLNKKSVCQVQGNGGSLCEKSITGKNPTNLKQHLKSIHPAVMNEFSKKEEIVKKCKLEEEAKKQETSLKQYRQSTLKQSFGRHTVYPKDSNQYKAITRKLAIFVGSSSVANSIVENLEFVDLLNTINPRYSVPGRAAIHKELDLVLIELLLDEILSEWDIGVHSSIVCFSRANFLYRWRKYFCQKKQIV